MVFYMLSIKHLIGGIKLIKDNNDTIAWVDLYSDLTLRPDISSQQKLEIINLLEKEHIDYNY